MAETKKTKPVSNFRDTLAELERLTAALEADDIDLDEAISYFESGSELAAKLQEQLGTAEQKIKRIKAQFDTPEAVEPEVLE